MTALLTGIGIGDRWWRGMATRGIYPDFRSMAQRGRDSWFLHLRATGLDRQFAEALAAKARIDSEGVSGDGQ